MNKSEIKKNELQSSLQTDGKAVVMAYFAKVAFDKKIKALEIGTWYGIGSTIIWLHSFKSGSEIVLLDAWRPYASDADLSKQGEFPSNWDYSKMDGLSTEAFLSTFLNVKKYENNAGDKEISLVRSDSKSFLNLIADSSFDFIYIDADHKYESVSSDIKNAKRLVNKEYGIICGDDLEKLPTNELIEVAKKHKDRDYIKGNYSFHPGVCLAVFEEFEGVNMVNGFWWIVCQNGKFDKNLLPDKKFENLKI